MTGRILIAISDDAARRSLWRVLTAADHGCESVAEASHATRMVDEHPFDLALCAAEDALCETLVAERPDSVPLVVIGVDDPEGARAMSERGVRGCLPGAFDHGDLLAIVEAAVEQRQDGAGPDGPGETDAAEHRIRSVEAALADAGQDELLDEEGRSRTLVRLSEVVGRRDLETAGHIHRIGVYSALLAQWSGMDASETARIRAAAPLHDVGKVVIPDSILLKPGKLDAAERALMQRHAEVGHRILSGLGSPLLDAAAEIALTHHERFDGSGYPAGTAGAEIPVAGRIVAVADAFDAQVSDRPYRKAIPLEQVVRTMLAGRASQFDPELLDLFIDGLDPILAVANETVDLDLSL